MPATDVHARGNVGEATLCPNHIVTAYREDVMCMNCGCMRAHDDMGQPNVNITYEDIKRAADQHRMTVRQVLDNIQTTAQRDEAEHPAEYAA
ncbi:MAG TPA: hypothetical protein VFC51_10330 [Chloroflexota bacterium]|nr:hypothetical protein [Chloroflexota bacterium]